MILDIDFPPDDRPEKEALSLIDAGFEVYILCVTKDEKPLREHYKGIDVTRIRFNAQLRKKLSSAYLVLPVYRWIWRKHAERFVRENDIDILHVHDLPLTDIAHTLARKYNLKVVCDQHEYWSNWIGTTAHYNTRIGKIVRALSNWKRYEREQLAKADLVITVTDRLREQYIQNVGIAPEKIITVPNSPLKRIFNPDNVDDSVVRQYKDSFVLFYAGVMSILRGIDVVIEALPELEKSIPNIRFVMAGRFSRNCNPLEMARQKGVAHLVEYAGWVPVDKLPSYLQAAHICVHLPNARAKEEANNTIATKMYQYAAMGKPIVTSEARMMRDFVVENGLGESIRNGDAGDFVDKVVAIYDDYTAYSRQVWDNSRRLLQHQAIFWEDTVSEMVEYYEKCRMQGNPSR